MKQLKAWGSVERRSLLAKRTYHLCPVCEESLYNGEELHLHHIVPQKDGGKDTVGNLVLLHDACHRQVHSLQTPPDIMKKVIHAFRKKRSVKLKKHGEMGIQQDDIN